MSNEVDVNNKLDIADKYRRTLLELQEKEEEKSIREVPRGLWEHALNSSQALIDRVSSSQR